jgi:hypothetical protein
MNKDHADQIMVVILNDMVKTSIPRMLAIQNKLEQGETLCRPEIKFFKELLKTLNRCSREFQYDAECMSILACIAHLVLSVANRALENEQESLRQE